MTRRHPGNPPVDLDLADAVDFDPSPLASALARLRAVEQREQAFAGLLAATAVVLLAAAAALFLLVALA